VLAGGEAGLRSCRCAPMAGELPLRPAIRRLQPGAPSDSERFRPGPRTGRYLPGQPWRAV